MVSISFIAGIIGMSMILIAFVLDEFYRKYNQDTIVYNVLNITGSFLLLYYAVNLQSVPFIILNAVWLSAAVVKLVRILGEKQPK